MDKFILEMDLGSLSEVINFNDREDDVRIVHEELEKEGFKFKKNLSDERNNLDLWLEVDLKEFHKVIEILMLLGNVNIMGLYNPFGFHLEFKRNGE